MPALFCGVIRARTFFWRHEEKNVLETGFGNKTNTKLKKRTVSKQNSLYIFSSPRNKNVAYSSGCVEGRRGQREHVTTVYLTYLLKH